MSQYRALDGLTNDWHFAHLARFALGRAGLVFTEATAVTPEGRRTHGDLGLWNDEQIDGLARIATFLKQEGSVAGMQLAHAGRKASERRPWHGETPVDDEDIRLRGEVPWRALGPSTQKYGEQWPEPTAMSSADIDHVIAAFGEAAARAERAGFDVIEVYAAHGFLLHQFYSPLSNDREDDYGGSLDNRMRLCREVARAIRRQWPAGKPLCFRLSATDWVDGGWTVEDTVILAQRLKEDGVDLVDCSSGGLGGPYPPVRFPLEHGFQAEFAAAVKARADVLSMTVGFIFEPESANRLVAEGKADLVCLAREMLNNPNWTLHAAAELDADDGFAMWPQESGWWLDKRQRVRRKLGF